MGITVDNATNNDTFFQWLEELGLNEATNHIRCITHILNLAVQDILATLKVPSTVIGDPDEMDPLEDIVSLIDNFILTIFMKRL